MPAPIKVGFIVGKDTDIVEDPKYDLIGDSSFLRDLPNKWRVDPVSHEYLMDCAEGTEGQCHCDVALAWYVKKNNPDIEVDVITPEEITLKRLKSNAFNFTLGYNAVNVCVENNDTRNQKMKAFKHCKNLVPTWEVEDFILYKSRYMKACIDAGIPMAPTLFSIKGSRSPTSMLKQIKARGWKTFVIKQSESGFSLGFFKKTVEACEADPSILTEYFKKFAHISEFIVQESIEGFTRNWETRCFWYNGEFLYAIANMAAVSAADGAEKIITGDDIPAEFLENAKRIGREALKCLPLLRAPTGQPVGMSMMRTDIGCSDCEIFDKDTKWDPNGKTFFLNEIEPSSTTYFVRWLKFDCLPVYANLIAKTCREIHEKMKSNPGKGLKKKAPAPKAKGVSMKAASKRSAKNAPMKAPMKGSKKAPMKLVMKAAMKAVMKTLKKAKGKK